MTRRIRLVVFAAALALGVVVGLLGLSGEELDPGVATGTTESTAPGPAPSTSSTAAPDEPRPITIAFAGDLNFEGPLRTRLDRDPSTAVGPFADVLGSADLAVGNLESAIAVGGTRVDKRYTFRAPPAALDALRAAGFDVVSMANNHGLDFGPEGLQETLAAKRAQPDRFVIGVGADDAEAFAPFGAVVGGQRVAVIAATQVLDSELIDAWTATATQPGLASAKRVDRLVEEVQRARADHDTVVVYLHWGTESTTCPNEAQQSLAARLEQAGADLIVGGHAHRLLGAGRLGRSFVAYGLGNFLFQAASAEASATGVLEVTVAGRDVQSYRWIPGRITGGVPAPLPTAEAPAAVTSWEALRACTGLVR